MKRYERVMTKKTKNAEQELNTRNKIEGLGQGGDQGDAGPAMDGGRTGASTSRKTAPRAVRSCFAFFSGKIEIVSILQKKGVF